MGLYKLCEHKGRNRDRCEHPWWGSFRGVRVSLSKWANRDIRSKAEAGAALDELRLAIRAGTFDPRGVAPAPVRPVTLRDLVELYRDRPKEEWPFGPDGKLAMFTKRLDVEALLREREG